MTIDPPSQFLSWDELACKDGTEYPHMYRQDVTRLVNLVESFEALRSKLDNKPLIILSAYRTPQYNKKIGGALKSQHTEGRALDIRTPKGMKPRELFDILVSLSNVTPIRGVGLYRWGCHMDVRPQTRLSLWKDNGIGDI
jgi:uncharacterized protein YcbK (DUF882 family)